MIHLGDFPINHTAVCIPWDSFAAATGASSAASAFASSDILIYKDGGTTQRSSSAGITVSTSFDSQTGLQMIVIDLSDNTDAGFYAAGHEYQVGVADVTIDSQTVRFWAAAFSIQRASGVLAKLLALLGTDSLPKISTDAQDLSGSLSINAKKIGGTLQTGADVGGMVADTVADLDELITTVGTPAGASLAADVAAVKSDTGTILTDVNTGGGAIYSRLGAPAGASIAADIAAAKVDTAAVKVQTDKLTFTVANKVDANALAIAGDTTAATNLKAGALGLVPGTCAAGSTTTSVVTNLTNATDGFYDGRVITFTSGALAGQTTSISNYTGSTKTLTVVALTGAPSNTDAFVIS